MRTFSLVLILLAACNETGTLQVPGRPDARPLDTLPDAVDTDAGADTDGAPVAQDDTGEAAPAPATAPTPVISCRDDGTRFLWQINQQVPEPGATFAPDGWTRVLPPSVGLYDAWAECSMSDLSWASGTLPEAGGRPDGVPGEVYVLTIATDLPCDLELLPEIAWTVVPVGAEPAVYAVTGSDLTPCP